LINIKYIDEQVVSGLLVSQKKKDFKPVAQKLLLPSKFWMLPFVRYAY